MISLTQFRRLINRFVAKGDFEALVDGGCLIGFTGCRFNLFERANWQGGNCIITYVFAGADWTVTLLDGPAGRSRLLEIVNIKGDPKLIDAALRAFKW